MRQEATCQFPQGEVSVKYKSDKQILFDKLENLLALEDSDKEISEIIETLRIKMGANGVERQGYIEYLIHQISDVSLPNQVKSLLNSEHVKKTYFWDELLDINHSQCEQQTEMEKFLTVIMAKSEEFQGTMKKLKRIKKCLLRRTGHLQSIIDYISSRLTHRQIAALLVRLNKEQAGLDPWSEGHISSI